MCEREEDMSAVLADFSQAAAVFTDFSQAAAGCFYRVLATGKRKQGELGGREGRGREEKSGAL